jgi:polar amino acid transport system substrate-binding protein
MRYILWRHLFVVALLVPPTAIAAQPLTLVTEENPPFNYTVDGKPAGMSTEIILEMARRAGVALQIRSLPWSDAYEQGQTRSDTCIYSMSRLPNRERLFAWVGEIGVNKWAVFGKTDFSKPVKSLADVRPFKVGGVAADSKVEFLRTNAVTNIKEVPRDELNPPRLFLERTHPDHIDLWVTGMYAADDVAAKAKAGPVKLVYVIREQPLWLACSPRTAGDTVKQLAAALNSMQKDGTYQRIVSAYDKNRGR